MPTARRLKEIVSLGQKKYRDRLGQCVIEGARSLESALQGGARVHDILLGPSAEWPPELEAARAAASAWSGSGGPPEPERIDAQTFSRVAGVATPPGILAVVSVPLVDEAELPGRLAPHDTVLVLDGIQDPGNVGTLIRTAAWFGVRAVVGIVHDAGTTPTGTADFFNPKTLRASMGGVWDVVLCRSSAPNALLEALRAENRPIWVADLEGEDARAWSPAPGCVLILGSEAHGPSPAAATLATGRVTISRYVRGANTASPRGADTASPHAASHLPPSAVESLNVAAAGAILLSRLAAAPA